MALETGNYISSLVKTNPLSSDNISEGDDHLQLIKKVLQRTFPMGTDTSLDSGVGPDQAVQVLIAEASPGPTIDTSASGNAARAMGLLWLDTSNNLLKIRNQANDAWITLSIDPETSNSVDINAGTIDGVTIEDSIIGAGTPAAGTFVALEGTAVKATSSLTLDTGVDMIFEGATADAYETTVTVTDPTADRTVTLPNATDTLVGKATTDTLTNKTMTSSGNTFDDSTSSVKGMASFSTDNFSVSSGAVTVKDAGIANAELANMAANTVKVRDANSSGVPSDVALATTEILIGDGTGFTAAALSGDATMTNAGAVTVTKIQGEPVSSTTVANDQYLKYSSAASEWQKVNIVGDDKLTTKGDLLVYNTVDSETRYGVADSSYPGTDGYALTALAAATNGVAWNQLGSAGVADNAITLAKLEDGTQGDILYYGASGAPTRLGFGTSGDVLTTGGTGANPAWATPTTGDITGVTAGSGLTGGGTSGAVTVTVGAGTGITVNASDVQVATTYAGGTSIASVGTVTAGTWEGTDVGTAHGGTGSSTTSGARTNLGVAIGSDVQAYNADTALTDVAAEWTKTQNFNSTELTFDATQDWDLSANQVCFVTLTANTIFDAPSNQVDGGFYSITLIQDGTGSRTASWNSVFHFAGGSAPTLTTTASAVDIMVFRSNGTNMLEVGRQLDLKTSS